jgi:hypothetical protein
VEGNELWIIGNRNRNRSLRSWSMRASVPIRIWTVQIFVGRPWFRNVMKSSR